MVLRVGRLQQEMVGIAAATAAAAILLMVQVVSLGRQEICVQRRINETCEPDSLRNEHSLLSENEVHLIFIKT